MSKIDPRVIKTLRQIDEALLLNLQKKSIQKITVDNICKTALINRSTFYKYYEDKYDLLDKYIERVLEDFKEYIMVDFVDSTVQNVDDHLFVDQFDDLITHIYEHKEEYQTLWRSSIDRNIYEEMTMIIHHQLYENLLKTTPGDKKKKAYCDYYAYILSSNVMALVHWGFMNINLVNQRDLLNIMSANMKEGIFASLKKITDANL